MCLQWKKDLKMTDTYKNKGLFFAQNSRSYGLAPCHLYSRIQAEGSSLMAQRVKNLPVRPETQVWSLGQEDPLGEGMATQSSILAWRIPWTEEPGGPQPMGSQRVRHDYQLIHTHHVIFTPEFRLKEVLLHGKFQLRFRRIERGQSQRTALEPSCWEVAWVSQREVHGPA